MKIINGRYSGETGYVQKTEVAVDGGGGIATILTDVGTKEITVFMSDLIKSKEVARGLDNLGGYELYDLVILAGNEVGVVIDVGREEFKILLQNGQVIDSSLLNIVCLLISYVSGQSCWLSSS